MTKLSSRTIRTETSKTLCLFFILSASAWGAVYIRWSTPELPSASSLGVSDIVFDWKEGISSQLAAARKQGYRVYVETPMQQATAAANDAVKVGCTGVILELPEPGNSDNDANVASLQHRYPKLRFLLLNANGKPPDMRGSLIIKRDSVLQVSSPTEQPWIDSNLVLVKVEQRSRPAQPPLYTFSWSDEGQQKFRTADDYSLALGEAAAFHSDLILQLDGNLQQRLNNRDAEALALWSQVKVVLKFSNPTTETGLEPAANVAVVVDHFDTSDEVLNLLGRHNIPYRVFVQTDLKAQEFKGFDILIVLAKLTKENAERVKSVASGGPTVVVVDARGSYPWQDSQRIKVNEHTASYVVGNGRILELDETVSDPETFAQDIRRMLGKRNSLLSLWNGLTTIAVPYRNRTGTVSLVELVNYAIDPVRLQVQVKGSFTSIRYESPEHGCCESLLPVNRDGFTEFVIPDLRIAGRVHLKSE